MVPSQIRFRCARTGTPNSGIRRRVFFFLSFVFLSVVVVVAVVAISWAAPAAYGGSQARG